MKYVTVILSILIFLMGCDLPWEPGPQPSYFDEKDFQNQFNVFGILRPGNVSGASLSFVHLETTYDYLNIPEVKKIEDAQVRLFRYNNFADIDTLHMVYTDFGDMFSKKEYRSFDIDSVDTLLAGKAFGLSCIKQGYPELISETTIPKIPVIIDDNITIHSDKLIFDILRDDLAQVYDIYLYCGNQEFMERYVRPENGNTHVELTYTTNNTVTGKLRIYAYDLKLSEYITYNIIIKPQTYQNRYSTVENGYGCFGSLNILETTIHQ